MINITEIDLIIKEMSQNFLKKKQLNIKKKKNKS